MMHMYVFSRYDYYDYKGLEKYLLSYVCVQPNEKIWFDSNRVLLEPSSSGSYQKFGIQLANRNLIKVC